jgi:hypothetical protein
MILDGLPRGLRYLVDDIPMHSMFPAQLVGFSMPRSSSQVIDQRRI